MFETYKFIHVLAAIVWVGGSIMAQFFAARLSSAEPPHRLGFARDLRFASTRVLVPSGIIVFFAGSLMIEEGVGFEYADTFVAIGLLAVFVSLGIAIGFLIPATKRAINLMTSGQGPAAGVLIKKVTWTARFVILVMLVAVWAMVVKP
ncbi:MAG TPA: DUF2269 family protein [Acidimicrobiia bacterium]|nr:DUF2269 family protein [Acidimicrobiia bacterium]